MPSFPKRPMSEQGTHREHVRFTGRVQGVGFRMTVQRLASDHPVAGWVRNEPDGSVSCLIEATPAGVNAFIGSIEDTMRGNIEGVERTPDFARDGILSGFSIKFDADLGR